MSVVVYAISIVLMVEVLASILAFTDLAARPRYQPRTLRRFSWRLIATAAWVWLASSHVGAIVAALATVLATTILGHYVPRIAARLQLGIAPKDDC